MPLTGLDPLPGGAVALPIVTVDREADAGPLAEALAAGGLGALEIPLRTPAALGAIRRLSGGAMVCGAGSILTAEDARRAAGEGAAFLVSPGLSTAVAELADSLGLPYLPGALTPGEVMAGLGLGIRRFKFFPAEAAGGPAFLGALEAPFPDARFLAAGGIREDRMAPWLDLPNVFAAGVSWIAPRDLVAAGAWAEISHRARRAAGLAGRPR